MIFFLVFSVAPALGVILAVFFGIITIAHPRPVRGFWRFRNSGALWALRFLGVILCIPLIGLASAYIGDCQGGFEGPGTCAYLPDFLSELAMFLVFAPIASIYIFGWPNSQLMGLNVIPMLCAIIATLEIATRLITRWRAVRTTSVGR
ncbi:MAG: hypothetical protein AAGH83_10810 [Pseudomonadota bacterium]